MRMITKSNLPADYHHLSVIKNKERRHCHRMAMSLERTLARCNEMYAEYESQTVILRDKSQQEGFTVGFELFFSKLVHFLNDYEKLQNTRLTTLRTNLLHSIKASFHDTVIVERIIHNLQVQCGQQKPLRIIIPKAVQLPDGVDSSNYTFSDNNHITVQNDMDSIRFPIDSVCQQWMKNADNAIYPLSQEITDLIPILLNNINQSILLADKNKDPG